MIVFIFILNFNQECKAQSPTVRITQTNPDTRNGRVVVVERDSELVMNCYVENLYQDMTVRWQREYTDPVDGLKKSRSISQDMALEDNIHFGIERPSQYTWSLRVRGVQLTDDGTYYCFVQLTQTSRSQDYRHVFVIVKPYIEPQNMSPDMSANQGDDVSLMCNASGMPQPNVLWSRLGGQVLSVGQEKYEGVKLPLNNIQASDRGAYLCTAMNEYGQTSHQIDVEVKFEPLIFVARPVVRQAVGYRIELQCFVESNPSPKVEISAWVRGTTTYTRSSDRYEIKWIKGAFNRMLYELIIKDVQPEDFGVFQCKVSNDDMTTGLASASIKLEESSTPRNSLKLGRPIRGDEDPVAGRGISNHQTLFLTLLNFLFVHFLRYLV